VYLSSSSTHIGHDVWLIDSGGSFHMNPHKEWFCKYKKYNGGDIFLGDELTSKIIGQRKVNSFLKDGRIRTLPRVFHIPEMYINLISVSNMIDAGVHTDFEKETCKKVRGSMVLMRGVWNGTAYNMLGRTINNGCNISIVPKGGNGEEKNPTISREKTMV
jgi:hypothetical protein